MILQQQLPCVVDLPVGIRAIQGKVQIAGQGLDIAGKQVLGVLIALLQVHASRPDTRQDELQPASEQLTAVASPCKAGVGHRLDVLGQTGVSEFRLWKSVL